MASSAPGANQPAPEFSPLVSRRGTVLALGALIYVANWSFAPGQIREARAAVGTLRMIGSIGVLLGLFHLVRRPPPVETAPGGEVTVGNPPDPSPPV